MTDELGWLGRFPLVRWIKCHTLHRGKWFVRESMTGNGNIYKCDDCQTRWFRPW